MARRKNIADTRNDLADSFARLTWEDLEAWAGDRVVSRGRSYQQRGTVQELGCTKEGDLVAWVSGSWRYSTRVYLNSDRGLGSECSCPYWTTCKHAVAVVLEFLEKLKKSEAVGQIEDDDPRLLHLEATDEGDELEALEGFEVEAFEEDIEDIEDIEDVEDVEDIDRGKIRSIPGRLDAEGSGLRTYLQKHTKAELVSMVHELAGDLDVVRQWLSDRRNLVSGQERKILQRVRRELKALEEPPWDDRRYGTPVINTDRLAKTLKALVEAGHAAEAMQIGPELLAAGTRVVEWEHEGESFGAVSDCLAILFDAVAKAPVPEPDKIEWAVELALDDEYDLCQAGMEQIWAQQYDEDDWSEVADRLTVLLETTGRGDSRRYKRDQIANWLVDALERAGRTNEIVPLCEREAEITSSYVRLVDRLVAEQCWADARTWCHRGIEAVDPKYPGIGADLRKRLHAIQESSGNPLGALAIQAEEFFAAPSLEGFQALCKAARKRRLGKTVDAWGRYYLETGRRPGVGRKRKSDPEVEWSLPDSEVAVPARMWVDEVPMVDVLIQLAIAEKKPEEVLKWYDHPGARKRAPDPFGFSLDDEVAEAVKSAYPDRAVAIWKKTAEKSIARVKPRGYEEAAPYLRQVREALVRSGRQQDWEVYLKGLRQKNSRRPRCLEVLDRLAGGQRPIIDV